MTYVTDRRAILGLYSLDGYDTASPTAPVNHPVFISFSFEKNVNALNVAGNGAAFVASFQELNDAQKGAARAAFAGWDAGSGITFLEVPSGMGDIKLAMFDFDKGGPYNSTQAAAYGGGGIVFVSDKTNYVSIQLYLHEIGHNLGFKHSFQGEYTLAPADDNYAHTVMSYTSGGTSGSELGTIDKDAVAYLYGAPGSDGTQVQSWSWDAATYTLTQTGFATGTLIRGIGGNNVITGGAGDDTINIKLGSVADTINAGGGNNAITIYGATGAVSITSGDGNDNLWLSRTIGAVTVTTGAGNDVVQYDVNAGSTLANLNINGGDGSDRINFSIYDGVTRFSLTDVMASSAGFGGFETVNVWVYSDGMFSGAGGNETIYIGGGFDATLEGMDGNDFLGAGTGISRLYGGGGNDGATITLRPGMTGSLYDGGTGSDYIFVNFAGYDSLTVSIADLAAYGLTLAGVESVYLNGTAGTDTISTGYTTASGVLDGAGGDDALSGGTIATFNYGTLQGGAGNDRLYSNAAPDFLYGGAGADRFIYTSVAYSNGRFQDQIEDFETGIDKLDLSEFDVWNLQVSASGGSAFVSGATAQGIFQLFVRGTITLSDIVLKAGTSAAIMGDGDANTLTGTAQMDYFSGGYGTDTIIGLGGDDVIDGGNSADKLYGGAGNDTYFTSQQDDLVFENAGEGIDTVISDGSFYLYANIENLTLAPGSSNFFGVGNDLSNTIIGNSGANTLLGGAGSDTIDGADGSDILYGQDGADSMLGGLGNDFLAGGAGDDMLFGEWGGDSLYGEEGNDTLFGGSDFVFDQLVGGAGNDMLHGDSGLGDYDYLYGNGGDDSFFVDTPADLVFEQAGEGIDTVHAGISGGGYYLYDNIENLVLTGQTPFGVGNALDNRLTGNAIGNYLLGGAGNDILNGKGGGDVLFGEAGADIFVFDHGTGGDVIGDFLAGTDKIDLSGFGLTWATVQNAMHEVNGTTAIDLGGGDFIVINGVANAALHEGDFILASTPPAAMDVVVRADEAFAFSLGPIDRIDAALWHGAGGLGISHLLGDQASDHAYLL